MSLELSALPLLAREDLAPLPARPSFAGIVADALSPVAGLDQHAASAATDLTLAGSDPADGFDATVADATSDSLEAPGADAAGTTATLLDRGDNLDQVRQSVSDGLPPPETPVTIDNVDPPPRPHPWPPDDRRGDPPEVPV